MARPPQETIDTFVSITGVDEAVAVRKLEEHGGDLNQAINSHFNEGDSTLNIINQNTAPASHDDMMDLDGPLDNTFQSSLPETFRDPFALMDPNFQQQFFDRIGSTDTFHGPRVSQPREAREIPIEVKNSETQTGPSDQAPVIEDVTGHESSQRPGVPETIIIDGEDDGLSSAASAHHANISNNMSPPNTTLPSAPPLVHVNDYDDDIEEEMIRAAIEASKKDAEGLANTTEQERDLNPEGVNIEAQSDDADMGTADGTGGRQGRASGKAGTSRQPIDEEDLQEEAEDVEEEPLVRRRSRRFPSENKELAQPMHAGASPSVRPMLNFQPQSNLEDLQNNGDEFPSEFLSQDDEYLASLQADQEKELKALQEAEVRRQEETAAREATIEKQKQEEEESHKKKLEEEELESNLASKKASLPSEPPPDNEGAVTLVVRMPDGSRQGRRFLKSDKLQVNGFETSFCHLREREREQPAGSGRGAAACSSSWTSGSTALPFPCESVAAQQQQSLCLLFTFGAAATCQQQSLRLRLLFIFGAAATYQEQSLRLLFTFRAAATCQLRLNLRLLFFCSMSSS
ncbi:hypothetical protein PR202_ga16398 [Eleusine coracana subsp. coracana]|uniref:UBX domain-containing protein n=1 Tax=Eleusine coracana subsp. coracana TaxID=191504 RepID=A0AAV5CLE9_ELECO|nr:hypothetical protein PR202_ga16398 [Eleusine coracana subsp. coracana]